MGAENEGKCLDAVLKVIEGQHRETRKILERDTPTSRGIELLCDVGRQRYTFEHTLIEPFPDNQLRETISNFRDKHITHNHNSNREYSAFIRLPAPDSQSAVS
jgi:hypothetical protein